MADSIGFLTEMIPLSTNEDHLLLPLQSEWLFFLCLAWYSKLCELWCQSKEHQDQQQFNLFDQSRIQRHRIWSRVDTWALNYSNSSIGLLCRGCLSSCLPSHRASERQMPLPHALIKRWPPGNLDLGPGLIGPHLTRPTLSDPIDWLMTQATASWERDKPDHSSSPSEVWTEVYPETKIVRGGHYSSRVGLWQGRLWWTRSRKRLWGRKTGWAEGTVWVGKNPKKISYAGRKPS